MYIKSMKKLFLILLFINFNVFAQQGEWSYVDGWVYTAKTNDATAGGAIIQRKKEENKYHTINGERYITTEERKAIGAVGSSEQGVFGKMKVIDTPQGKNIIIPINCKALGLDGIGFKTPEPNSNSLLLIGFAFLLFIRSLSRNNIQYFKP